jgi:uncharacterized protein (DUF433 family)
LRNGRVDELIARYVELDPERPSKANARLKVSHVPVWALAGYSGTVGGDVDRIAEDYDLPREEVEAALAFYERHKVIIDDRLAANRA